MREEQRNYERNTYKFLIVNLLLIAILFILFLLGISISELNNLLFAFSISTVIMLVVEHG